MKIWSAANGVFFTDSVFVACANFQQVFFSPLQDMLDVDPHMDSLVKVQY